MMCEEVIREDKRKGIENEMWLIFSWLVRASCNNHYTGLTGSRVHRNLFRLTR